MEDAISIIKNPPKWQPQPGENEILDVLKKEFASTTEAAERQRKLDATEKALQSAKTELATKEKELSDLEASCAAIAQEMEAAAAQVVEIQDEYHLAIKNYKQLAGEKLVVWRQLHPESVLCRDTSEHWEAPTFVFEGGVGKVLPLRHLEPVERSQILAMLAGS
ncbi:hypothetical protein NDA03_25905 [Trichocoleus sp. Lan]|uniref:hypothetical protein n=1 Tax=Trichocoleus sp. Lan TaxID=2933927 RepID=UPI00329703BE